jgi:AcrR family transcriptional regulator
VAISEPTSDGRSARTHRTRDAVVESLLAWLRDGNLRPTAKDIAERAGISVRSVYVHFDDLDDLFCAASEHQGALVADLVREIPATGSFDERLTAVVEQRIRVFEAILPVQRAAALQEPFSPTLQTILRTMRDYQRSEIERVFAAELDRVPPVTRSAVLDAAHLVAVEESWAQLRGPHGLDVARSRTALETALRALLGAQA